MKDIEDYNDNSWYLFYQMMKCSLKTDDVKDGIDKSLFLLKSCLQCGDVVLHKMDLENGVFVPVISNTGMKHPSGPISCIVNKTSNLAKSKGVLHLDLNLSDNFKNMVMVFIKTEKGEYILSLNNTIDIPIVGDDFYSGLEETMSIIIKRAEMYAKNIMAINHDLLTGLDNRNSYETFVGSGVPDDKEFVYGVFDLFGLKSVNDEYGHSVGDRYIQHTARILNKYWPKETSSIKSDGTVEKQSTGHCVYRIGGDEFVLITTKERLELAKIKASLASEEVSMMDLGTDDCILGLNYGLVIHDPNKSIKQTYYSADQLMYENKKRMYNEHGIERRKYR